jgi:hypothetical protein
MCWSLQVSVLFASFEAIVITILTIRSFTSKKEKFRSQKFILPLLFSVFLIETLEAFLWLGAGEHESIYGLNDLFPIKESVHGTCSSRNKLLTYLVAIIVLLQPYIRMLTILDLEKKNLELIKRISVMKTVAIFFFISALSNIFLGMVKFFYYINFN